MTLGQQGKRCGQGALGWVQDIFENTQMSGGQTVQKQRLDLSKEVMSGRLDFVYWILEPLKSSGKRVT